MYRIDLHRPFAHASLRPAQRWRKLYCARKQTDSLPRCQPSKAFIACSTRISYLWATVNLFVAVWAYAESSYVTTDNASYCNASRLSINTSITLNFHSRLWQSCHSSRKSLKSSQFLFLEHNTGFSLANGTVPFRNSNMPFGSVPKPTMCPLGPPQNQHIFNNHLNY